MAKLTRRDLLVGAGASLAVGSKALAGVPVAGKQVPSFYRSKLGDFELTVVSDGARPIPLPPRFVLNVPNEEVLKAAEAAYMPKGTVFAPFNPLVVNTGSKLVLIDTGYGPIAPTVGLLPQSLAAAGIDPKSIDIVLISHMHGDHINGIKSPDGALAFPNAEIMVPSVDWAHWMSDENMAKATDGFQKASFGFTRKIFSDLKDKVTVPDVLIQPHSASLGMTFYQGTQFPSDYQGDAFAAEHGSWNRSKRTGYKVIRIRMKDGKPTGEYEDFVTGFVVSDTEVWGRPVGVAVAKDGSLLVSEDGNGTIWRATRAPQ